MTQISPTQTPLLYAIRYNNDVLWSGTLERGQALATVLELISSPDDNLFLAAVSGKVSMYNPLPSVGTPLKSGDIYGWNNGLVIVRQSHIRTVDDPAAVPALFSVYRAGQTDVLDWIANEKVEIGTKRKYNGIVYEAIQAHTTQVDWTPDKTPALWAKYVIASPNWAAGVAYKIGDIVLYVPNGHTYKCIQAHTSQAAWNPPAVPALWQLVS